MKNKEASGSLKQQRLGATNYNNQGCLMKVVEYNNARDIVVEFQDEYKEIVHTRWENFKVGKVNNPSKVKFIYRLGLEKPNYQGCLMKIIEYNNANDIVVEFQDEYKYKLHTKWRHFRSGYVKNIYAPTVCGVGIIGNESPMCCNRTLIKEYLAWNSMLQRCFDENMKQKCPAYQDVTCCKEWLYYPNFYKWLHSQKNFEIWKNNKGFALDKDILVKGNRMYGPDTCCLVPIRVNSLFTRNKKNIVLNKWLKRNMRKAL